MNEGATSCNKPEQEPRSDRAGARQQKTTQRTQVSAPHQVAQRGRGDAEAGLWLGAQRLQRKARVRDIVSTHFKQGKQQLLRQG